MLQDVTSAGAVPGWRGEDGRDDEGQPSGRLTGSCVLSAVEERDEVVLQTVFIRGLL